MKTQFLLGVVVVLCIVSVQSVRAVTPTAAESATARQWVAARFAGDADGKALTPPFSFNYDGKPSAEFLYTWKLSRASRRLDDQRTEHRLVYSDPKTGLQLRCVGVEYRDSPAVEWTLYLKNTGKRDTPILSEIMALDAIVGQAAQGECFVNHNTGDPNMAEIGSYRPLRTPLAPGKEFAVSPERGLPTHRAMPYFNVEWGGRGAIVVLGWPGEWFANISRERSGAIRAKGFQLFCHCRLHPGEEVRTPRAILLWWEGDTVRGQNLWRRWMIAHNIPRPGGKLPKPMLAAGNCNAYGYIGITEKNQLEGIDQALERKLSIDFWWVDAGWYWVPKDAPMWIFGTWEPDKTRFPNGLKPVMDYAHSKGLKTVLWFAPESVRPGTWIHDNHKDWMLGNCLLNLGHPEAWNWLVNHVDRFVTELKLDIYRHDNDVAPMDIWAGADPSDRVGITENRYVSGFLAYYDELLRRHPNLMIDNCCAGGRRNDADTLRRSVPLWKSDICEDATDLQCQAYGLASWVPYFGHAGGYFDSYRFRSNMYSCVGIGENFGDPKGDFAGLRRSIDQWRRVAPNFLGDYYPLTPYSRANDAWMAWQYDRPEVGEGIVQAFRRPECGKGSIQLRLRGLDPDATYEVRDFDKKESVSMTGKELMSPGLSVTFSSKPAAALIMYQKK
jgi:alpha-galactosidase